MAQAGEVVFRKREAFIREFIPIFQSFYSFISQDREKVGLSYDSLARDASLLEVLKESRARYQISLVLPLRPFTLDGEISQKHIQLVLVHTAQRTAGGGRALSGLGGDDGTSR